MRSGLSNVFDRGENCKILLVDLSCALYISDYVSQTLIQTLYYFIY